MLARKALGKGVGFGVDNEVDFALTVERDLLAPVSGHRNKAHLLEQPAQFFGFGGCVLDEFKAVGAHRVVPGCNCHFCLL